MSKARIARLEARLARIEAKLADKRRRHHNCRVRAAMTAAYIAGLAAGGGGPDVIDVPAVSLSDKLPIDSP